MSRYFPSLAFAAALLGISICATTASAAPVPVSYWNFDESSSGTGTAFDSNSNNDGTFLSSAVRTTGLIGTGAAQPANVTGSGVNVGTGGGDFSFTTGFTVETIFTTNWNGAGFGQIFRKEDGNDRILFSFQNGTQIVGSAFAGISLGLNIGGYAELDIPFDGLSGRPTLGQVADGNVHHLVGTYDSVTGLKAVYYDGALIGSVSLAPNTLMLSDGAAVGFIGNRSTGDEDFPGVLDEVALYGVALSAAEVTTHYNNVQAGDNYFVPEPSACLLLALNALGLLAIRRRKK